MFYELISTRCKNGLDILAGKPINREGYKVYSCSSEIYTEDGIADLTLLADAASAKQTYKDSYGDDNSGDIFMDDAYLYYSPDFGKNFLVDFHPVHFQQDRKSDYANRPGNFLNHILIGSFSDFYIWELFGDNDIWCAKQKDETYYYETDPEALKPREITPSGKYYTYEQIRDFISDGRAELLKKAVSFLISQYKLEPEERKYILIRDTSSENIELWVAAIECAFSPRMSSGLPFATRMENYKSRNTYTVKNGKYQTTKNFQDASQKRRLRAMIIGLNTKDKSANNNVRPLPTDEFVLLDAVAGKTSFETEHNLSGEYFSLIASFSSEHKKFCTEFLQSFRIEAPVYDLPELYRVYKQIQNAGSLSASELSQCLSVISRYKILNTEISRAIYDGAKGKISAVFRQDFDSALRIAEWLKSASEFFGDNEIRGFLSENICGFVKSALLSIRGNTSAVKNICLQILSGDFKDDTAKMIVNPETISQFTAGNITPEDCLCFLGLYFKSAAIINSKPEKECVKEITSKCVGLCAESNDKDSMRELLTFFAGKDRTNSDSAVNVVLASAGTNGNFAVNFLTEEVPGILSGFESVSSFCEKLNASGLKDEVPSLLRKYMLSCKPKKSLFELPKFIDECKFIDAENKARLFLALDGKIDSVDDSDDFDLSEMIQKYRPADYAFPKSANIAALNEFEKEGRSLPLRDALEKYRLQGFPNMTEGNYPEEFAATVVVLETKKRFNPDDLSYIFSLIMNTNTPEQFLSFFVQTLMNNVKDCRRMWNEFLLFAVRHEDLQAHAFDAIFTELCEMSDTKKVLRQIRSETDRKNKKVSDLIEDVGMRAKKDIEKKKGPSFLGRLSSFWKSHGSDAQDGEN